MHTATDFHIKNTDIRYDNVKEIVDPIECRWNENLNENIYFYSNEFWDEYLLNMQAYIGKTPIKNVSTFTNDTGQSHDYYIICKKETNYEEKIHELLDNDLKCLTENYLFMLFN